MGWIVIYALTWGFAWIVGWFATRLSCRLAIALDLIDRPKNEAHKNHAHAVPVAGGIGMCLSWLLTLGAGLAACSLGKSLLPAEVAEVLPGIGNVAGNLALMVGCVLFLVITGAMDDRKPMKAGLKFFIQFLAAGLTCWFGPRILVGYVPMPVSWLISVLWVMTVTNALNFFDNMDGLAGGTGAIASMYLLLIAAYRGQFFVAILAAAICGVTCGFLMLNRPPARIFMGDSGSHFLGYMLGVLCIMTTFYQTDQTPTAISMLIPILVLGIPLFDAITVVCIRLRIHKPIYVGDNRHISHRFNKLGLSRPMSVLLISLLSLINGAAAVTLLWLPLWGALLVLAQMMAMFTVILIIQLSVPENSK